MEGGELAEMYFLSLTFFANAQLILLPLLAPLFSFARCSIKPP